MLDTGPLVAYFSERDQWHDWAGERMQQLTPPLWSSEPILTEACFLIARNGGNASNVIRKSREGIISTPVAVEREAAAIETLMRRYANVPMSLADASLVRLSELYQNSQVFTLDRDFVRYRRFGRHVIPLLVPW
jgi:predicted nucleic acid-binding protein